MNLPDFMLYELTLRVDKLEKKVYKSHRIPITLAQQLLLLKHTGILDKLNSIFKDKTNKAKFLSILLDADEKNANIYLNHFATNSSKIINKRNYEVLVKVLNDLELTKEMKECEAILNTLSK